MSFWRFGNHGLLLTRSGASRVDFGGDHPEPTDGLSPQLIVGYVDAAGVRRWDTVVDGETVITGVAPFFVEFFAGGTRSEAPDGGDAHGAWWNIEYLIDYGEGLGGTWSRSGRSRDTDRGFPIFGRGYTAVGTHQARLWVRDSEGRQTSIGLTVVVTSGGAGTTMTSGVLPSFVSGGVYNAPAGGTWPAITNQLDGLHNVVIRKTGVGADPAFGSVTLDGRNEPTSPITRTRGVRFLNCDVAGVTSGNVGFDYCAFVGGRVRSVTPTNMQYAADQIFATGRTEVQANNVRMYRGLLLQDTGELNDTNSDGYVMIGEGRGLHLVNVLSRKTTSAQHNIRGVYAYSSFRHCLLTNTVASVSYVKFQGWACTQGVSLPTLKGTPDEWGDQDYVVNYGQGRRLGLPSYYTAMVDCQFGASGDVTPTANAGFGAQNNDAAPAEGNSHCGFEHCRWVQTSTWFNVDFTGRSLGLRDCRLNLGAGGAIGHSVNVHPNRCPDGWAGPYVTSGARPVPTPF